MNMLEIALLIAVDLALFASARLWLKDTRRALLAAAVLAVPLALSVGEVTQFLTTDEFGILQSLRGPDRGLALLWQSAAMRSTFVWAIPVIALAERIGVAGDTLPMLLKGGHWFVGSMCILALGQQFARLIDIPPARRGVIPFVGFFSAVYLLPTDELALKIFNYDSLSLFLAVLALVVLARAFREKRRDLALWAIALATLAAQEKLSASLILVLAVAAAPLVNALRQDRPPRPLAFAGSLIAAIGVAIGLLLASAGLYAIVGRPPPSAGFWWGALDPFSTWIWVPIRFLVGGNIETMVAARPITLAATFAIIALMAAALVAGRGFLTRGPIWLPAALGKGTDAIVVLVFTVGVFGLLTIQPYWGPYEPVRFPNAGQIGAINSIVLHFGSPTFALHRLNALAYAYAVFVVAMPSVFWAIAAITLVLRLRGKSHPKRPELDLMILLAAAGPLIAGLMLVPVGHRYLNIPLLLFVLGGLGRAYVAFASQGERPGRGAAVAVALLALIAVVGEVAPFRPLFAAFRPIWVEYRDPDWPIAGHINESWVGWGEEVMIAGKYLRKTCRQQPDRRLAGVPCDRITLYSIYTGAWLGRKQVITVKLWNWNRENAGMTAADYYLINRSNAAQGFPMPAGVEPEFTIRFRGFAQAWVFRGDRLAAAGYQFDRTERR